MRVVDVVLGNTGKAEAAGYVVRGRRLQVDQGKLDILRKRQEEAWAAAQQVVITGATGSGADLVNGRFVFVDREVYQKVGATDRWLFLTRNDKWMVGGTDGKNKRKIKATGWAHSVVLAGGMPPVAGAVPWRVLGDGDWVEQ
eukprot:COSAG06_NODE_30802_length_532_cov_0.812933_1_plen_141_part_10